MSAVASRTMKGLGACRTHCSRVHVGGDDLITGTAKFFFLPRSTKELSGNIGFRCRRICVTDFINGKVLIFQDPIAVPRR